jgi:hypothetical protein
VQAGDDDDTASVHQVMLHASAGGWAPGVARWEVQHPVHAGSRSRCYRAGLHHQGSALVLQPCYIWCVQCVWWQAGSCWLWPPGWGRLASTPSQLPQPYCAVAAALLQLWPWQGTARSVVVVLCGCAGARTS